jgi:hypothetical protein
MRLTILAKRERSTGKVDEKSRSPPVVITDANSNIISFKDYYNRVNTY